MVPDQFSLISNSHIYTLKLKANKRKVVTAQLVELVNCNGGCSYKHNVVGEADKCWYMFYFHLLHITNY